MYSNVPTYPRSGSALLFPLVSSLPTLAKAAVICLSAIAFIALSARPTSGANIVWVSDSNDGATGFFGPLPNQSDSGFVTVLQAAGHNVIRYNQPNGQGTSLTAAELAALHTNDLIIISRCVNSGAFQPVQGDQWNVAITKPLIDMSPYHVRTAASRLGWFAGDISDNFDDRPTGMHAVLTGNPATDAVVDYLFGGVVMNGTNTVLPYTEMIDRNTSHIPGAPVAGSITYATANYVQWNNPATMNFGYVIVGFPAGTAVRGGANILGGYRMFFAGGSREGGIFPSSVSIYAGRENLSPTGEDIFLRAVQVAINNGAAPATDPNAPVAFTTQPASATVPRGGSVTFSVTVSGAAPRTVQWQRDTGDGVTFTNIPDAGTPFSMSSLTLSSVSPDDNNAKFRVEASNPVNNVVSDVVTLTVTPDATAPVPLTAAALDGFTIHVVFNEKVDPRLYEAGGTALDPFNYFLTDGSGQNYASTLTLGADGRSVFLTFLAPVSPTFSLSISLVEDLFSNGIDPAGVNVDGINRGLIAADVGAANPPGGSTYAYDANTIVVNGGGVDFQATAEQFRFVHRSVAGDFDARVRVHSIIGVGRLESCAKAILSARETLNGNAMAVNAFVTPPYPSDSTFGSAARATTGGNTLSNFLAVPYGINSTPAVFPAWLRVKRAGDVFTTYGSNNGTDWTQVGTITVPMGPSALVGMGVNSHRGGDVATATFSDFAITQAPNQPTITSLSYTAGAFSGSFQSQAGFNYLVRYKDDLNATTWQTLTTIAGDGTVKSFTDPGPAGSQRFYELLVQ